MTRTKIALAAALLIGTGSAALAEDGYSKPAKRYATQQASKRLNQDRNMSMPTTNNLMMNVMDRASSPFSCGG